MILSGSPAEIPALWPLSTRRPLNDGRRSRRPGVGRHQYSESRFDGCRRGRASRLNRAHPNMELADPVFDETAGEKLSMYVKSCEADKFFAGPEPRLLSLRNWGKIASRFRISLSQFRFARKTKVERKKSTPPISFAKLSGSDPALRE